MQAATMLPVSATETVDYVPEYYRARSDATADAGDGLSGGDAPAAPSDPPHYQLGVATSLERARWERDIEMQGARRIPAEELWAALELFVEESVVPEHQALATQALAIQRAAEAGLNAAVVAATQQNGGDPIGMLAGAPDAPAADVPDQINFTELGVGAARAAASRLVGRLQDDARRCSQTYAALRADHDFWTQAALYLAVRHFCRGWTGLSTRCKRANGQITEESMRAVPALDIVFVGARAIQLATLSPGERKN